MKKYKCMVCGYIYDPGEGDETQGIAKNTPFDKLPEDWTCPVCGATKDQFEEIQVEDFQKILTDAMEIELNGIELYKTASEKTDDKQAKEVFDFLPKEEFQHFKALKQMLEAVKEGKEIVVALNGEMPLNRAIFSDEFRKNLIGKNYEFSAISTGLILEKNSMDFYRKNKEKAENRKIRDLFAELEKWETAHYEMLLGEYNDLKQQYWEANNFSPF